MKVFVNPWYEPTFVVKLGDGWCDVSPKDGKGKVIPPDGKLTGEIVFMKVSEIEVKPRGGSFRDGNFREGKIVLKCK